MEANRRHGVVDRGGVRAVVDVIGIVVSGAQDSLIKAHRSTGFVDAKDLAGKARGASDGVFAGTADKNMRAVTALTGKSR